MIRVQIRNVPSDPLLRWQIWSLNDDGTETYAGYGRTRTGALRRVQECGWQLVENT